MKKVLMIIGHLNIGGEEKVAKDIGLFSDRNKYQIDYLVFTDEVGEYEIELKKEGFLVIHLPEPSDSHLAYIRSLRKLIKKNHYDVVHSHIMFNSGWNMLVARQLGVPVRIAHSHSIRIPGHHGFVRNAYHSIMRFLIDHNATHLVGCGKGAGEWMCGKNVYERRGITVYNGIDTERFRYDERNRQEVRAELGLTDQLLIGHTGHMFKVKNQQYLIRLLPHILKKTPNAVLLFLGDGEDREMLENLADELKVKEHIIFKGNVPDVYRYLSAMDVFAFPSLYEGMPLSLMEVQANGLPCIISDRIPDDVHITDLVQVLPLEKPKKWVTAIYSSERSNSAAYAIIVDNAGFDKRHMTENIYKIYD